MGLHVRLHFGEHGQIPMHAEVALGFLMDVTHVPHDDVGMKLQSFEAVVEAGLEQITLGNAGWRGPTDQGYE